MPLGALKMHNFLNMTPTCSTVPTINNTLPLPQLLFPSVYSKKGFNMQVCTAVPVNDASLNCCTSEWCKCASLYQLMMQVCTAVPVNDASVHRCTREWCKCAPLYQWMMQVCTAIPANDASVHRCTSEWCKCALLYQWTRLNNPSYSCIII